MNVEGEYWKYLRLLKMRKVETPKRITIKKREGMYPEQFYLLEKGDIIKMVRSGSLRMVEEIHKRKDSDKTYMIELLKMRPSWTRDSNTWYCASDAFMFKPVRVKNELIYEMSYERIISNRVKVYGDYYQKKLEELEQRAITLQKGITFAASLCAPNDQGFLRSASPK
jgi:hypothetical protein